MQPCEDALKREQGFCRQKSPQTAKPCSLFFHCLTVNCWLVVGWGVMGFGIGERGGGLKMGVEIVNKKWGGCSGKEFVYIGRGSEFGNPFRIGEDGNREEVIEKYRWWFLKRVTEDPAFRRKVWELEGKKLVCFCAPARCHGEVLKWWLENE